VNELAFAVGALCHYPSDTEGHAIAVNRTAPLMYPKLQRKYGATVPYDEAPKEHIMVEFAFDVLLVAHGGYKLQAYHDFIASVRELQKRTRAHAVIRSRARSR